LSYRTDAYQVLLWLVYWRRDEVRIISADGMKRLVARRGAVAGQPVGAERAAAVAPSFVVFVIY
jgi:hypothetical protein